MRIEKPDYAANIDYTRDKGGRELLYKPEYCDMLKAMREDGLSVVQFCAKIRISTQTFYKWKKDHPEFAEADNVAKAHAEAVWEDRYVAAMYENTVNASMFNRYMSVRFNWAEKQQIEQKVDVSESIRKLQDAIDAYKKDY